MARSLTILKFCVFGVFTLEFIDSRAFTLEFKDSDAFTLELTAVPDNSNSRQTPSLPF